MISPERMVIEERADQAESIYERHVADCKSGPFNIINKTQNISHCMICKKKFFNEGGYIIIQNTNPKSAP